MPLYRFSRSYILIKLSSNPLKSLQQPYIAINFQFERFLLLNIYNERQLDKNSRTQRNSNTTISRAILKLKIDLPFVLIGDYNLHHTWWNALAKNPTKEAKEPVNWLDKNNCQLLNSDEQEGTFYRSNIREKSIIDLAFYSGNF